MTTCHGRHSLLSPNRDSDRVSQRLSTARGPGWFGLSQNCLTSHADRLTIGGDVKAIVKLNLMRVGP
jgi:hypothetical protein